MLNYLEYKKTELEKQKAVKEPTYADIEEKVEQFRKEQYTARYAEIDTKNMLIDAQVAILDEVSEEALKADETKEAVMQ